MKNILKLLLLILLLLIPLEVYGEGPKIVRAWLGVFKYNNDTFYDPLGNTFEGESSYNGPEHYYVVINYELNNGEIIRQTIKLNDYFGTTHPAATAVLSWTAPNGTTYTIFKQSKWKTNTYNVVPLPYITEIPVGSQIEIIMNNNYWDDNYKDGHWIINISENGINFINAYEFSWGHFHNSSFVFQNLNRNITWEINLPYKNPYGRVWYSGIIPFNGSEAIIYNISGNTTDSGKIFTYLPPEDFFSPSNKNSILKVPVPIDAVIISILLILVTVYKRD